MELDRADLALLEAVQHNNRLTSEELAEVANLSPTACQRRLKKLRGAGVIEADVSIVSPKALGRKLTMIVLVSLERERADIVDRFKAAIRKTKDVMLGYYVTGDADFILIVTAKDMEDYELFTRRFFLREPRHQRLQNDGRHGSRKSELFFPYPRLGSSWKTFIRHVWYSM